MVALAERDEAARRAVAAQQEAARRHAFDQVSGRLDPQRGAADVDVTAVAGLLDEEDEEEDGPGYGQIMLGMTLNQRRDLSRARGWPVGPLSPLLS